MQAQHFHAVLCAAVYDMEQESLSREKNKAHIGTDSFIVTIIKSKAVTFYVVFESQGLDIVHFRVLTIPVLSM